jgi:hypothetical protein
MNGPKVFALINREIRRVPLDWQHPKYESGQLIPLFRHDYYSQEERATMVKAGQTLQEIASQCMPDFSHLPEEQLGLCVYETTSEGLPVSPVFVNTPEGRWALVTYCAQRVAAFGYHQMMAAAEWAEFLFGDSLAAVDLETGRIEFTKETPAR